MTFKSSLVALEFERLDKKMVDELTVKQ